MDKRKLKNFSFENSVLKFESFINDFTEDLYNEFDSKSNNTNY